MIETVNQICERIAKDNPDKLKNCNYFLQAVFQAIFGYQPEYIKGLANDIIGRLGHDPFHTCNATDALKKAAEGKIVVGGVLIVPHGHVFIVKDGPLSMPGQTTPWKSPKTNKPVLSRGGYPQIYNGSQNSSIPKPLSSVDIIISPSMFAQVKYAWIDDPRRAAV